MSRFFRNDSCFPKTNISEEELNAFYEEGYTQRNLLDIILGLSQKVISNYTNHIAETPLDDAFQKFSWSK